MQPPQKDLAIILKSVAYEERHRIVTALTENHGMITAVARNSIQSRRFGGTLEPFAASEWLFNHKPGAELYSLSEALIKKSFASLSQDFEKYSLACAMSELILRIAPQGESCLDLFRLHSNALSSVEEADFSSRMPGSSTALLNTYLGKLLQWSGNQPRLHQCLGCELPLERVSLTSQLSCRAADAGWICESCQTSEDNFHFRTGEKSKVSLSHSLLRLSPLVILDFQRSLTLPIRQAMNAIQVDSHQHKMLFQFLEAIYIYHVPGFDKLPLKSLRFLGLKSTLKPLKENPLRMKPAPAAID